MCIRDSYTLTYMMQNAVEHGTGKEAALYSVPVAGKTGTSGQYMDRWFVGCTPYYVAAVWTGYDEQEKINVSGNPAAQLWKKVMSPLHDGLAWKSFTYPYLEGDTGAFGFMDADDDYLDDFIVTDPDTGGWDDGSQDEFGGGFDNWGNSSGGWDDGWDDNWGGSGNDDFLGGGGDIFLW